MSLRWLLWEHKQVGQMETSALQTSGSCKKKFIYCIWERDGNVHVAWPKHRLLLVLVWQWQAPSTWTRAVTPPSLLLSYLLLGSHCLGVVKGRRRRVRSCCTAVRGTHPTQAEEVLLLLFLFFPSCDHAQSGLHHFSDRLSKRLLCDLFLLPVTIMK